MNEMIRKLVFVGAFAAIFAMSNAQNRNVITAYNYGIKSGQTQYDKAMKAIDDAVEHVETKENEKAWYYRGLIYQNIFQSPKPEHKELHPNPLREAAISYMNSVKFKDKKARYADDALKNLKISRTQAFNEGIKMFEADDFKKAALYFELSAEIGNNPNVNTNEEAVYFNIALSHEKAGNIDEAKTAYKLSAEKNYEPVGCIRKVAELDLAKGDTLGYVNTLKEGVSKLADNQLLMLLLIDFYSKAQQFDEALMYLDKAIELDPTNKVYFFAKGTFYDQKGESDKAFAAYKKSLDIDPVYFDAVFNLGVLYFNKGADINNKANDIPPHKTKEYDEMRELAIAEFIKATEYFEKALEINPKDIVSMKQLKLIYFQIRTKPGYSDKLKAIDEKIQQAEQ
jgi:tetratricopeptide (TPR) repeat protein